MPREDKNFSGVLFKNDKRDPGDPEDRRPWYKGRAMVDNKPYWVSAWVKTASSGQPFVSLAFTPRQDAATTTQPADDPLPF